MLGHRQLALVGGARLQRPAFGWHSKRSTRDAGPQVLPGGPWTWVLVWDLALPSADALPVASMRRPWFSGQIWEMDERADHWDPPEAEGAPGDASDG